MPVLLFAFLYVTQASTCHADVSQVGTSPLGLRFPPFPAYQSSVYRRVLSLDRWFSHRVSSCSRLSGPQFPKARAARIIVNHLIRDSIWHLKCLGGKGPIELGRPYLASAGPPLGPFNPNLIPTKLILTPGFMGPGSEF